MRPKLLLLVVLLIEGATTVHSWWFITKNQKLGEGCSAFKQCSAGYSCQPFIHKCYHKPRRANEPCSAGYSCGSGLTCLAGRHVCVPPAKNGESCHLTKPCGRGLSCQPGVHKCYHSPRRENDPCSAGYNCRQGLSCTLCGPGIVATCQMSKVQPFSDTDYQKPYNEVAFLVTHNSYSYPPIIHIGQNQRSDVRRQLKDGVRGFMLDIYPGNKENEIRLCHGTCNLGSTSLLGFLKEFSTFLDNSPREVITFFIEDKLKNNALLMKVLDQAKLSKHLLRRKHFGNGAKTWPTLEQMVSGLGGLVVFSDNRAETDVIGYTYNYVTENNFGSQGKKTKKCENRGSSRGGKSLVLVNWFSTLGNPLHPCLNNARDIKEKLNTCHTKFGRWANFIAVDYYGQGKYGGAFKMVQWLNEKLSGL